MLNNLTSMQGPFPIFLFIGALAAIFSAIFSLLSFFYIYSHYNRQKKHEEKKCFETIKQKTLEIRDILFKLSKSLSNEHFILLTDSTVTWFRAKNDPEWTRLQFFGYLFSDKKVFSPSFRNK